MLDFVYEYIDPFPYNYYHRHNYLILRTYGRVGYKATFYLPLALFLAGLFRHSVSVFIFR
jgi:hypothetical protein